MTVFNGKRYQDPKNLKKYNDFASIKERNSTKIADDVRLVMVCSAYSIEIAKYYRRVQSKTGLMKRVQDP